MDCIFPITQGKSIKNLVSMHTYVQILLKDNRFKIILRVLDVSTEEVGKNRACARKTRAALTDEAFSQTGRALSSIITSISDFVKVEAEIERDDW